jgi:hypothetical protein
MKIRTPTRSALRNTSLCAALAWLLLQCSSVQDGSMRSARANREASAAWELVYQVLEHPRCMNCHPSGSAPLVGDDHRPHPQNVQAGPDGMGSFAMRCATCHQTQNLAGAHMPPGAPNWHLPSPRMPLVFEGRSSGLLCRQLRDPTQNGGRTPEQLLHHAAEDPLVLWGWDPGEGRAPVSISHAEFVEAMRAWIAGGCDCPP